MKNSEIRSQVAIAVKACQEKKAENITVLQLDENSSGFTDYFLLCSGTNPRQVQAIADAIDQELSAAGVEPKHKEGYNQAEWLLKFYDLERLWKTATRIDPTELVKPAAKKATKRVAAKTTKPAKKTPAKKSAPAKRKTS
jgi:ribosome-associated protein